MADGGTTYAAIEEFQKLYPLKPVIMTTANAFGNFSNELPPNARDIEILAKPVPSNVLIDAVERHLTAAQRPAAATDPTQTKAQAVL